MSVFARFIQNEEDRCLGVAREVLEAAGWPARSWQQDGLLVEDKEQPRRNREGRMAPYAKEEAMGRLKEAIGAAEAAIWTRCGYNIEFSVKDFFDSSPADVLFRFSGADLGSNCRVHHKLTAAESLRGRNRARRNEQILSGPRRSMAYTRPPPVEIDGCWRLLAGS